MYVVRASVETGPCRASALVVLAALAAAVPGCIPPAGTVGTAHLLSSSGLVQNRRSMTYTPDVTWWKLPNGLTVMFAPDPHTNVVRVDLRVMAGGADEPAGKAGLAHLVEHMMFSQRAEPGGPTIADRLATVALDSNAFTTADTTHFYAIALASDVDRLLAIEASRLALGCRGIDADTFAREASVVGQELGQRGTGTLGEQVRAALFGAAHPYTRSTGGRDLAALTLDDVCRFATSHYAPDRALLAISGRIDPTALQRTVADRFGALDRRAAAPVAVPPVALTANTSVLRLPVATAHALVVFPASPWGSGDAVDEHLLDELIVQRLRTLARDKPWVFAVDHGILGGARARVRYFDVAVGDPARVAAGADLVLGVALELADQPLPPGYVESFAMLDHTELLDRLGSLGGRAMLCADAMQFARDLRCRFDELGVLEQADAGFVRIHAARMLQSRVARARTVVHKVLHILPSQLPTNLPTKDGHAAAWAGVEPPETAREPTVWRAAVDRSEARRALALPVQPAHAAPAVVTLPNGLRVVMVGGFTQPIFDARLVFPVGRTGGNAADDGIAEAAAQLLHHDFQAGYSRDDRATLRWMLQLGAELSSEVTRHTAFRVRGSAAYADWHLWRLAWLVRSGVYSDDDVVATRSALLMRGGRTSRDQDLHRALFGSLFGADHPFARTSDPTAVAAALSVDQLGRFRDAHYAPAGATLILTGSFDPAAMRRRVIELFGTWNTDPPARWAPVVPPMHPAPGPTWLVQPDPTAAQVQLVLGFAASSPRTASRAARAVVQEILDKRLALIRTQLGATYGIDVAYHTTAAGDLIEITGRVDAARAGEVVRRVVDELGKLRATDDALADDFVRARRTVLAAELADLAQPSVTARRLEYAVAGGLPLDIDAALAAAVATTTLDDATRVIAQDLQPARMVGVLGGRDADVHAALEAAGISHARVLGERGTGH
jgi:zinc protease